MRVKVGVMDNNINKLGCHKGNCTWTVLKEVVKMPTHACSKKKKCQLSLPETDLESVFA